MEHFLIYLAEASLCLLCFFMIYFFILRNETYFQWNRIYLLTTILFSLFIPFFSYSVKINIDPSLITSTTHAALENNTNNRLNPVGFNFFAISYIQFIAIIYCLGFLLNSFVFVKSMRHLFSLFQKNKKIKKGNVQYILSPDEIGIFSFFNHIFIDKNKFDNFSEPEKERVLEHELAHISGKHSLDLLLMEILKIIFWFNPIIYFYKSSLAQIHEYIADYTVIKKEGSSFKYAEFLVGQVKENIRGYHFCNNLFHEPIKSRLIMMKKSKSKPREALKFLSVFPVMGCLVFYLCIEYSFVGKTQPTQEKATALSQSDSIPPHPGNMPLQPEKGKCYAKSKTANDVIVVDVQYPVFTGHDAAGIPLKDVTISSPKSSKWVKKKTDKDCQTDDCFVWALVETGGDSKTIRIVEDITTTNEYEMRTFKVSQVVSKNNIEWVEVLCSEHVDEKLISELQLKLKTAGYDVSPTEIFDKKTKAALFKYQKDNNLPAGNLNIQSLQHLKMG